MKSLLDYQFKDSRVCINWIESDYIRLFSDEYIGKLYKEDAIAIASHFGLLVDGEKGEEE